MFAFALRLAIASRLVKAVTFVSVASIASDISVVMRAEDCSKRSVDDALLLRYFKNINTALYGQHPGFVKINDPAYDIAG